jgi:hypothetical protein
MAAVVSLAGAPAGTHVDRAASEMRRFNRDPMSRALRARTGVRLGSDPTTDPNFDPTRPTKHRRYAPCAPATAVGLRSRYGSKAMDRREAAWSIPPGADANLASLLKADDHRSQNTLPSRLPGLCRAWMTKARSGHLLGSRPILRGRLRIVSESRRPPHAPEWRSGRKQDLARHDEAVAKIETLAALVGGLQIRRDPVTVAPVENSTQQC